MTVESLTSEHVVTIQVQSETMDDSWTVVEAFTNVAVDVKCLVQEMDSREQLEYAARGLSVTHDVYFAADPEVTSKHRLLWEGKYLRVHGAYKEGRPGEFFLWIVQAEWVQTRPEPAAT